MFSECGGKIQSPISINYDEIVKKKIGNIKYTGYNKTYYNLTISNTGHTIRIKFPESPNITISEGLEHLSWWRLIFIGVRILPKVQTTLFSNCDQPWKCSWFTGTWNILLMSPFVNQIVSLFFRCCINQHSITNPIWSPLHQLWPSYSNITPTKTFLVSS